jgi:predicted dehydrogenase
LVEKPLATSSVAADSLVEACRAARVVLQVGHVERYNPALRNILPYLHEPKYIEAVRASTYTFRSTDIGVVLDLMIHDLDLALWLVGAPACRVDALGISVLGGHEDVAQARITFENGCIANFSASRVSYRALRKWHCWTTGSFASVDFAGGESVLVEPSQVVLDRQVDVDALSQHERQMLKEKLFERLLQMKTFQAAPANAIAQEQQDFIESIRSGEAHGVTGEAGRDALVLAQRVLDQIAHHRWDGTADGRVGPFALTSPPILRGPHWPQWPARRQAG